MDAFTRDTRLRKMIALHPNICLWEKNDPSLFPYSLYPLKMNIDLIIKHSILLLSHGPYLKYHDNTP